jgi:hypothetical protein
MYRTARVAVYDVMDQVFISAVITEYRETPGTLPPVEYVLSATVPSRGLDDPHVWLLEGLAALTADEKS